MVTHVPLNYLTSDISVLLISPNVAGIGILKQILSSEHEVSLVHIFSREEFGDDLRTYYGPIYGCTKFFLQFFYLIGGTLLIQHFLFTYPSDQVLEEEKFKFHSLHSYDDFVHGHFNAIFFDAKVIVRLGNPQPVELYKKIIQKHSFDILLVEFGTGMFFLESIQEHENFFSEQGIPCYLYQMNKPISLGGHSLQMICSTHIHPLLSPLYSKENSTKYYWRDIHLSSFGLPEFLKKKFPHNNSLNWTQFFSESFFS
eukprot:TRINITY_DN1747_c0_g1_i5.p1 TRINITY_DN1747_c0_g1~~TRINITY_DN1747_c0_g1_i5.p1  ORF type:complete len:256 (-),score=37.18 TRINITY_DN1747_c0_g1_i5:250-1017(-)